MSSVCRVCLAGNTTLHCLKNNQLVEVYEKLSNTKFNSDDARSRALCHLCYRKLLRCHSFSQMAHRSEKIFNNIYDKGLKATHQYITELDLGIKQELSVATRQSVTNDGNAANASSQVTIKAEPTPGIDIKEEVTAEQDKIVEVESVAEHYTKNQSTLEEFYIDEGNDVDELLPNFLVEQTKPDDSKLSFCCNNCNKIFFLKSKLISHIRKSHSYLYRNQYSQIMQNTKDTSMIEDKIIHNHTKRFACDLCEKHFNQKRHLITHIRIHTGEKPFACNVCDKQFIRKDYLIPHMRIHTVVKPFACNVCNKKFNSKSYLVRHIRIHTEGKPFACNVCDKLFNQKRYLISHMKTHTGEKPYPCNVCDKQFNQKCHLVEHTRTHTGEKPFACTVCNKLFASKSVQVRHMRIHMKENLS